MVKVFFSPVVGRDISMKYIYQDQILILFLLMLQQKAELQLLLLLGGLQSVRSGKISEAETFQSQLPSHQMKLQRRGVMVKNW